MHEAYLSADRGCCAGFATDTLGRFILKRKGQAMSDIRRGAGMGFGLIAGIIAAAVLIPAALSILMCGGCAMLAGTGTATIDEAGRQRAKAPAVKGSQESAPVGLNEELVADRPEPEPAGTTVKKESQDGVQPTLPADDFPADDALADDAPIDNSIVITMTEYNKLSDGLAYDLAVSVVGYDGEELSRVDLGGIETVMVVWKNENGSNANATFQNGRLVAKAQFGLPSGPSPLNIALAREKAEKIARLDEERRQEGLRREMEEARHAAEVAAMEPKAAAELSAILSDASALKTIAEVDALRERLDAFQEDYAETPSAERAKGESDALALLRLAYYSAETLDRDPKPQFRKLVDRYPATIAAKVANGQIGEP